MDFLPPTGCHFEKNRSYSACSGTFGCDVIARGGGGYFSGQTRVVNCIFLANQVLATTRTDCFFGGTAHAEGVGIYSNDGSLIVENSILAENLATTSGCNNKRSGVGLFTRSGTCRIINSTFAYNEGEAIFGDAQASTHLTNSIVYFNVGNQVGGTVRADYSNIQGGFPGTANIDANPIFQSRANLMIVKGSRCIDAGSPSAAYNDACTEQGPSLGTVRNDIGAHGGPNGCGWLDPIKILELPKDQRACLGSSIRFRIIADGQGILSYQWYFEGTKLDGQTASTLSISSIEGSDAGRYTVEVSDALGHTESAFTDLAVTDACIESRCYAGLTITGIPGRKYILHRATDVQQTNWTPVATNTMSSTGWFYLDQETPNHQLRFYKVTLLP